MTPAEQLEHLRHRTLTIAGVPRPVTLHPPRVIDVSPLIGDPPEAPSAIAIGLVAELVQVFDVDGAPIDAELAQAIVAAPDDLRGFLEARSALHRFCLEAGRIRPICPRCDARPERDLLFYALALQTAPRAPTIDGVQLAPPHLAARDPRAAAPARPRDLPRAAGIGVDLPSARLGFAGAGDAAHAVLGDLEATREAFAWARYAPPDVAQPDELSHWRANSPGFRTMLRLSVALRSLVAGDGTALEPTPATMDALFFADALFLDLTYHLTHDLSLPEGRGVIDCSACSQRYLAVR